MACIGVGDLVLAAIPATNLSIAAVAVPLLVIVFYLAIRGRGIPDLGLICEEHTAIIAALALLPGNGCIPRG